MVEINKNTLTSDVDSIISGLTLSTEDTEVLSLMYKAAINAGANANTIATELTTRIEAASSNTTITDALLFSVMTDILTVDREMKVATIADLQALTNISPGSVYYVESLEVPYIKTSGGWEPVELNSQLGDPLVIGNFAYAWGNGASGGLGDNSSINKSSPVSVVGGFTDWIGVSAGALHSAGLRSNGTAWAWGWGAAGQLGDNTTISKSSPVSVIGGFTDWTQVSAGRFHVTGVRANGTAWAWGSNVSGQLGDNTATNKSSPVSVVGGFTDWAQVSAGTAHSLGLRANGTAWGWGAANNGRLGDNSITNKNSPVSVVGGFTDWTQVSAGDSHSLAIRANGTAWAWGLGSIGRLGDNTTVDKSSPVSVAGGFTDWTQVSGGANFTLGLRSNGTAWGWGYNGSGQLGDNTNVTKSSPVSVVGGFTDWTQLSAGQFHSIGLRGNGSVWSWGFNGQGRLGDNTTISRRSPVSVIGGFTDWTQVSAGVYRSLGIVSGIV